MKQSRILKEMHETMSDLYASGAIDKKTMKSFDVLCLNNIKEMTLSQIQDVCEEEPKFGNSCCIPEKNK